MKKKHERRIMVNFITLSPFLRNISTQFLDKFFLVCLYSLRSSYKSANIRFTSLDLTSQNKTKAKSAIISFIQNLNRNMERNMEYGEKREMVELHSGSW